MADNKTKVIITASDQTAAGLRSAENALQGFAGRFVSLTNPIALAGTAIAAGSAALVASVKSAIDTGDSFNKLSQKTGIAVESLSALAYAGDLSGVSIDSLANGIKKLSVNMSEAAGSTSGKAAEAFKALGISVTDANGALRSSEDVLREVADSFASMKDGAGKTALAVALFGKAGADLIPLLNQGSKGLNELTEEAKALGLVMSGQTAKSAEEFNDNIRKLALSTAALGRSITADLIGPLAEFTRLMVEARTAGAGFFGSIAVGLRTPDGSAPLDELRERAGVLQGRISQATGATDFVLTSRAAADRAELARLQKLIAERLKQADDFGPPVAPGGLRDAPTVAGSGETAAKKGRLARPFDPEADLEFTLSEARRKALKEDFDARDKEADAEAKRVEDLRKKYVELADPLQKYRVQLDEINQLRAAGTLTAAQALEAEWKVNEQLDAAAEKMTALGEATKETDTFAQDLGLTFTSAFEDAVIEGKKFSDVLKSLGDDLQRIILRKTVTEPLGKAVDGLVTGSGVGDFFKGLFGGGKAGGGGVDASKFYLVGERGPELFAPGTSGSIIPNGAMGGGNVVVNVIESPGRGGEQSRRNEGNLQILDIFVDRVKSAIAGDIADGRGSVPAALQSSYGLNRAAGAY